MATRRRLDAELVRRGLVDSRAAARTLVQEGRVLVGGSVATKPARMVDGAESVHITGDPPRFVGRGGEKLAGALDRFGVDPTGLRVLDAGASTGGFTDCLLQAGAAEVVALDVGRGQLHERLRSDERVVVLERTNLRHVERGQLGRIDAAVGDLSFISLTVVLPVLVEQVEPGGWMVLLVKPQFEAGRQAAARGGGVISDPEVWREALSGVVSTAEGLGAAMMDAMVSPLRGAEGNVEFCIHLVNSRAAGGPPYVDRAHGDRADADPGESAALIDAAVAAAVEAAK